MTEQNWKIGDCQDLMREMDPDSVDLIVTDPPYGYSFMGKDWDRAIPTVDLWKEALRVLKPGAFAFIMSAPRQDVLAHNLVNLSNAGFETGFTSIYWTYASGFPKAGNISKMVDKQLGVEREVIGKKPWDNSSNYFVPGLNHKKRIQLNETKATSSQVKELDGSYGGFQPKPAVEVIMVVMKPLSEKTYVNQAMENEKGITWLDDGRIPFNPNNEPNIRLNAKNHKTNSTCGIECINKIGDSEREPTKNRLDLVQDLGLHNSKGRFPANLLVSDDVLNDDNITSGKEIYGKYNQKDTFGYSDSGSYSRYFDLDAWFNTKYLPKKVQKTFPFMIVPKASKNEKKGSTHPTVKPIKLFSYLMTIGSRKNDLILDPFLGSGTTLTAGRLTNRNIMGFELDPQWEEFYSEKAMKNKPPLDNFW